MMFLQHPLDEPNAMLPYNFVQILDPKCRGIPPVNNSSSTA